MTLLTTSLPCSSVARASNWYLESHGFHSHWGFREFFFRVFRLENASSKYSSFYLTLTLVWLRVLDSLQNQNVLSGIKGKASRIAALTPNMAGFFYAESYSKGEIKVGNTFLLLNMILPISFSWIKGAFSLSRNVGFSLKYD